MSKGAADIVFSMSGPSNSGGPVDKKPKPSIAIRVGTGGDHRSVPPTDEPPRQRRTTTSLEADRLRAEVTALEERRRSLAEEWTEDITRPIQLSTINAINWEAQPAIPAEKIDWSHQGEPLRVRPTLGAMVVAISMIASILGAGAYFYWGVRLHVDNAQIHVPANGVPWGVESRDEAKAARQEMQRQISDTMRAEHDKLRTDILGVLKPDR